MLCLAFVSYNLLCYVIPGECFNSAACWKRIIHHLWAFQRHGDRALDLGSTPKPLSHEPGANSSFGRLSPADASAQWAHRCPHGLASLWSTCGACSGLATQLYPGSFEGKRV